MTRCLLALSLGIYFYATVQAYTTTSSRAAARGLNTGYRTEDFRPRPQPIQPAPPVPPPPPAMEIERNNLDRNNNVASSWSPRSRSFSISDLNPFPHFSNSLTDKNNNSVWSPRSSSNRPFGINPLQQRRRRQESFREDDFEQLPRGWSPRGLSSRPEFANPRGLRRWNPFKSRAYQDAFENNNNNNGWNPRRGGIRRQPSYYRSSFYNREKMVQGTAREYFDLDPAAPAHHIWVDTPAGRPMQADIEVFDGPDNTPVRFQVYAENGQQTPFCALVGNGSFYGQGQSTVSVRNTATLEFPLRATVQSTGEEPLVHHDEYHRYGGNELQGITKIQGNSLRTWTLDPFAAGNQIAVTLESQGLPVQCTVELWGISNHVLQEIQVYQQDGVQYPTSIILDTAAYRGNSLVVAIRNTGSMSFPITATVQPYLGSLGNLRRDGYSSEFYQRDYNRSMSSSSYYGRERDYDRYDRSSSSYYGRERDYDRYDQRGRNDNYSSRGNYATASRSPSYRRSMHPQANKSIW